MRYGQRSEDCHSRIRNDGSTCGHESLERSDQSLSSGAVHLYSEAVRGAFLKSWSANDDSDEMISIIFQVESDFDVPVWIERVPSQSNPSDILSRETVVEFGGAERAEVDPWEMWSLLTK